MAGYCSARKLTNVKGRIDYISNPKRQECIESYYNTADTDFWSLLAAECQQQHKQQVQKKIVFKNGQETVKTTLSKCCEAREFIVGIPQDYKITAKEIAEWFKAKYGVECSVALHWKEKTQNFHAHIIYAERTLLKEPAIIEHKRTYYYDADGKKCKKADAVKVVPKGIETRYFSDKNKDFKTAKFALEFKKTILANFGLDDFDRNLHFATKHIGKNNPKSEYISEYNKLIGELNKYFDLVEGEYNLEGRTPKQVFCEMLGSNRLYIPQIEQIKEFFVEFGKLYPLNEKTAQNRNTSLPDISKEELIENYKEIKSDISSYFKGYNCYFDELKRFAYWEQNGHSDYVYRKELGHYKFEFADMNMNRLIEKYNMTEYEGISPIKEDNTRSEAYEIAKAILEALQGLLERIKEWFVEITGLEIEPVIEEQEREEIEMDMEDDWF